MKSERKARRVAPPTLPFSHHHVARLAKLETEIEAAEQRLREIRADFKAVGRLDLVCEFLKAPAALKRLADYLWCDKSLRLFGQKCPFPPKLDVALLNRCPQRFVLQRSDSIEPNRDFAEILMRGDFAEQLTDIIFAKVRSKFRGRMRYHAKKRRKSVLDLKALVREWAVEISWLYPLEEWACIFPAALLARDEAFIQEITNIRSQSDTVLDLAIAIYWYSWPRQDRHHVGLGQAGLPSLPNDIPPLMHWSNKAACEFVTYRTGKEISPEVHKKQQSNFGLRIAKPTIVGSANYKYDGQIHSLTCER